MKGPLTRWRKLPLPAVLSLAAVLVLVLALVDLRTGIDIRFSIFYWLPIAAVTWRAGRGWGLAAAGTSAVARLWSESQGLFTHDSASVALLDFLFYFISYGTLCLLLAKLRDLLDLMEGMAHTDQVTGIPNARAFHAAIQREIALSAKTGLPLSLAYMDVDNFKKVNDHFGHEAGDDLLRRLVPAARTAMRAGDMMARLGGDEFAILLPSTGEEEAATAVERLRGNLGDEAKWPCPVTLSVGIITVSKGIYTVEEILHAADALMYEVKRSGKDGVRQVVLGAKGGAVRKER